MTRTVKARILSRRDTTANWNALFGFIPMRGEIIVYTDRYVNNGQDIPGIKIGDGTTYCIDLPFVSESETSEILEKLNNHINNMYIHVSEDDRDRWDSSNHADFSYSDEILYLNISE